MSHASSHLKERSGWTVWLAAAGRGLFGKRLFVGLAVALLGVRLLTPQPFFADGHRLTQTAGLCLILAGLLMRAWGSGCAGRHTRSAVIEAPRLVTGGPFAHVRNPIYTGTICLGFGMAVLIGDPLAFLLATLAFVILYFSIVPAEEQFLRQQFGPAYDRYRQAVPRLIPRLIPWRDGEPTAFQWKAARGEWRIGLIVLVIYVALHLEEHVDRLLT